MAGLQREGEENLMIILASEKVHEHDDLLLAIHNYTNMLEV